LTRPSIHRYTNSSMPPSRHFIHHLFMHYSISSPIYPFSPFLCIHSSANLAIHPPIRLILPSTQLPIQSGSPSFVCRWQSIVCLPLVTCSNRRRGERGCVR
jgi:hypothetical protein